MVRDLGLWITDLQTPRHPKMNDPLSGGAGATARVSEFVTIPGRDHPPDTIEFENDVFPHTPH